MFFGKFGGNHVVSSKARWFDGWLLGMGRSCARPVACAAVDAAAYYVSNNLAGADALNSGRAEHAADVTAKHVTDTARPVANSVERQRTECPISGDRRFVRSGQVPRSGAASLIVLVGRHRETASTTRLVLFSEIPVLIKCPPEFPICEERV
jgi:hypothetical protein